MRPVAIFRFSPTEGPGHFATFLDSRRVPWQLIAIDEGVPVPASPEAFSGIVLMGGHMSVNDDLPWIPPLLELIRQAIARRIPVLGHCLGGQLIARATGGSVGRNPVKEIGWGGVRALDNPVAKDWLGDFQRFDAFQWHGETFTIPAGATRILESDYCPNQAYVLDDLHLGMQCHVEMTDAMIREWCDNGAGEIAASDSPAVQTPDAILGAASERLPRLSAVAESLYSRWLQGLARD